MVYVVVVVAGVAGVGVGGGVDAGRSQATVDSGCLVMLQILDVVIGSGGDRADTEFN